MVSTIKVCMGSSCFARGNAKNLQLIQKFITENNLDAEVELSGLRCCNDCSQGPNISIDEISYTHIDNGTLLDILEKHFHKKSEAVTHEQVKPEGEE